MFYRGRHDSPDTYCRGWRCPCPALCPAQDPPPAATARILSPLLLPLFRIVNLVSHSLPSVVPRTLVPRLVKVDSICYASPRIIFNVTDKCPTLLSLHTGALLYLVQIHHHSGRVTSSALLQHLRDLMSRNLQWFWCDDPMFLPRVLSIPDPRLCLI